MCIYIYIYKREEKSKQSWSEWRVYAWKEKKKEKDEEWIQTFYQQDEHSRMNAWKSLSDEDFIHACNFLFIDNKFNSII